MFLLKIPTLSKTSDCFLEALISSGATLTDVELLWSFLRIMPSFLTYRCWSVVSNCRRWFSSLFTRNPSTSWYENQVINMSSGMKRFVVMPTKYMSKIYACTCLLCQAPAHNTSEQAHLLYIAQRHVNTRTVSGYRMFIFILIYFS